MNMEIKFRAWDASQNYMAYQGTPDLETIQSFFFHFGGEECIKMLSIGKCDKNGKEIFDGDLFKSENQLGDTKQINIDYTHGIRAMIGDSSFTSADAIYGEVIGNIYESHDLVTKK